VAGAASRRRDLTSPSAGRELQEQGKSVVLDQGNRVLRSIFARAYACRSRTRCYGARLLRTSP
jgi:hypothetical protein